MRERLEPENGAAGLERLLKLTAQGDRDAFGELYTCTHAGVYALALSLTGSASEAEELCHDAYLRVWDYAGSYRPKGTPMAWILAITRNLCLMELRKRGRRAELTPEEWDAIPQSAPDVSPEDRELLQTALGVLETDEREIVTLHAVSGLKHREIGKLMGMNLNTVLSKYRRALAKMRRVMEGE